MLCLYVCTANTMLFFLTYCCSSTPIAYSISPGKFSSFYLDFTIFFVIIQGCVSSNLNSYMQGRWQDLAIVKQYSIVYQSDEGSASYAKKLQLYKVAGAVKCFKGILTSVK